jgi:hypothetical protein
MSETPDYRRQHLRNLQGEIAFRVTGEVILPDYYRWILALLRQAELEQHNPDLATSRNRA